MFTKITNEISQVGGGNLTSPDDAAVYLINFGGHAALVDAGGDDSISKLLKNIGECGVKPEQIEYLLITHCHFDHTGGAKPIRDKLRCKAVAHELEAPFIEQGDDTVTAAIWYGTSFTPFPIDKKIRGDQEDIDLGGRCIKAIHTPGHSPGSMVFLTESEGLKILFGQDVHGPLDCRLKSDRKDYVQSLKLLISLEADILCEGHFGIYKGKKQVANYIKSFL